MLFVCGGRRAMLLCPRRAMPIDLKRGASAEATGSSDCLLGQPAVRLKRLNRALHNGPEVAGMPLPWCRRVGNGCHCVIEERTLVLGTGNIGTIRIYRPVDHLAFFDGVEDGASDDRFVGS